MAFTLEEIHAVREEETKREKLPLSAETRGGLEHVYRDGPNPGRHTFKRISLRDIPDFTANDHQLRIVVAQTAYAHFRTGAPWKRIPETLTADLPELYRLIAERFEKYHHVRHEILNKFNTTKDYIACLSAVAYFKWRVGLHHDEIATCLQIPLDVVTRLAWRLRASAFRLGMPVKVWLPPRGTPRSEVAKRQWADPEFRAKQAVARKAAAIKRWSNPKAIESQRDKIAKSWTPERRAAASAWRKAMNATAEFRAKMQEVAARPGHKEKQSDSLKKLWTPEYKAEQHRKGRWKDSGRKPQRLHS